MDELLKGELNVLESGSNVDVISNQTMKRQLTPDQKKERAIIALAASIGTILRISAFNFGWLG